MPNIIPIEDKYLIIRAYCETCEKFLLETAPMTKKELISKWEIAVFEAPLAIKCEDCTKSRFNFNLKFKVFNKRTEKEDDANIYLPNVES